MLMDLDSANKTKLMDKVLQPYVPQPLKDGDMVQFGDIFGVFRLLEENDDLPMTQAIDIPETPISTRHISKFNKAPTTTVPESPDVSDRDDSFIAPSQAKTGQYLKKSNSHFIKPSLNVISIQPIGSKNIDNVYWSSGKHSLSLNSSLDESNDKFNISNKHVDNSIHEMETQSPFSVVQVDVPNKNIHEMETQLPFANDKSPKQKRNNINEENNIHEMETQMPYVNDRSPLRNRNNMKEENRHDNIHELETQIPYVNNQSPNKYDNIHEMQTQIPFANDNVVNQNKNNIHEMATQLLTSKEVNDSVDSIYTAQTQKPHSPIRDIARQLPILGKEELPEVCKIDKQHEMKFDLFTANKENEDDIFTAETQPFIDPQEITKYHTGELNCVKDSKNQVLDISKSDDDIVLEEMDAEYCEDDFQSQPLFPLDDILENNDTNKVLSKDPQLLDQTDQLNKNKKIAADIHSDSSADCEDIINAPTQKIAIDEDDDLTDCEDTLEDIPKNTTERKSEVTSGQNVNFEDLLTQKIDDDIDDCPTQIITAVNEENKERHNSNKDVCFEDMPTQIISEEDVNSTIQQRSNDASAPNVINKNNFESPFKIPLISPIKVKRKEIKLTLVKENLTPKKIVPEHHNDNDENYYAATQDILEDLCSQQGQSPQAAPIKANSGDKISMESDDELVPCSVEEYKTGNKFPHLDNDFKSSKSTDSTDEEEISLMPNLSSQQIREVIGVSPQVDKLKKVPSEPSDVEVTPKKVRSLKFMDVELPDSQEIKTTVSLHHKISVTESSSESETENDSQEQCTPILFRKKRKPKKDAKVDLTKKFDVASLPTRIITRVRKPTVKLQNNEIESTKTTNILKPKFITEQEDEIDKDIIHENISRLKNKSEKSKRNKDQNNKKLSNVKDNKKQKENQKQLDIPNNGIEHKIEYCINIKDSKECVKIDSIINERTENKVLATRYKSDNSSKSEPKLKSDSETSALKTTFSDKDKKDDICKNTSTETNVSTRSKRSTRNRKKVDTVKDILQVDENEDSKKTRRNKSSRQKQPPKKPVEIDLTEEIVTEVRRSKRQRSSREKKDEKPTEQNKAVHKSILKKDKPVKHEQSTVYSLSSGSGTDSPLSLKRSAMSDLDPPSPKRTRSNVSSSDMTLRSTPARFNKKQYVLFTAFPSEEVRVKLEKLGKLIFF
ncbi:unnamed protein product [Diatraea saccharalis]|uniref:Uncharacterized protein n=1 Tax=Diatraea saccharalis TaxID=40085 RepID=A0A9P0G2L9_9NEOP|nr:unnamed protein product [Diatraea saccharalis]